MDRGSASGQEEILPNYTLNYLQSCSGSVQVGQMQEEHVAKKCSSNSAGDWSLLAQNSEIDSGVS